MKTKQAVNLALEVLGRNGLSGVECETTSLPSALRLIGLDKLSQKTLTRITAELRRQNLVEVTKLEKRLKIQLSVKAIHRIQRSQVEKITIPEPVKWDGYWRMVTYDVPRANSAGRRLFVEQLKRLGFSMVRESVWFHPYPCFKAVTDLTQRCNLQRYVTLAEISKIDNISLSKLHSQYPATARVK